MCQFVRLTRVCVSLCLYIMFCSSVCIWILEDLVCALVILGNGVSELLLSKTALEIYTKAWHFFNDQPLFGLFCFIVIGKLFRFLQAVVHFLPKKSPFLILLTGFYCLQSQYLKCDSRLLYISIYLYFLIYLNINLRII